MAKLKEIAEFGDFQTPPALALAVTGLLRRLGVKPDLVVEPTCGRGAFLVAASQHFPGAHLLGLDINRHYLDEAKSKLSDANAELIHASFFDFAWAKILGAHDGSLLVLGNPPWVTNAELGALGSTNLPVKTNFQKHRGLDALTGKANFDISEWMLLQNVQWLGRRKGAIAVLCKTAVARKVLRACWRADAKISDARIYKIDALAHFGASVDACLFFMRLEGEKSATCAVYDSLGDEEPSTRFGLADGHIVSDLDAYDRWRYLRGPNPAFTWRSGLKHDCSKVMELERGDTGLTNGYGMKVDVEETYLFPLLKSSDVAGTKRRDRERFVIVTQRTIGESTESIRREAPKTWAYLHAHADVLSARSSIIYKNKPPFSIFGVGPYAFAPWKIAISGLYKRLAFKLLGPIGQRPVMFDDTVYLLPFDSESDARAVLGVLESVPAQKFFESQVHWADKRPITVDLLKRLDIAKLMDPDGSEQAQRLFA